MSDLERSADIEEGLEDEKQPRTLMFPIVGIGASAGGLEAFNQLLTALPADTGMAFVIVQHLDPAYESQLVGILSRTTTMPVVAIEDGTAVESNSVYVIGPNTNLSIHGGKLRLAPRLAEPVPHLPIDLFFESLAEEQRRLSIGVILSGTGSDGTRGLAAIKSQCGVTFAQKQVTAKFDGMPLSAIVSGAADFVLSPAEIARELGRLSTHPYVGASPEIPTKEILPDGDGELRKIFGLVKRATGVDFSNYRQKTTRRRIGRRMVVHRSQSVREYFELLLNRPEEVQELYKDFLISVTHFFRDPLSFSALAEHVIGRIRSGQLVDSVRVWVPGCATGEEVYSLAICLDEVFRQENVRPALQLFGTDISDLALGKARAGRYVQSAVQDISAERLSQYFNKVDGHYQIRKSIRDLCIFAKQDVTHDPPFSRVDLISCRNMLIYLGPVLQKAVLPIFHYSLKESGLLFLGPAETVGAADDLFDPVNQKHKIFVRKSVSVRLGNSFTKSRGAVEPLRGEGGASRNVALHWVKQADAIIQQRYAPDGVVINKHLQIQQWRGRTDFYLQRALGDGMQNLLLLAHESLQTPLRDAVKTAIERHTAVQRRGVRIEHQGEEREITIEVVPISTTDNDQYYFVVFERTSPLPAEGGNEVTAAALKSKGPEDEVAQLRHELAEMSTHLRSLAEEHDAALEEQRAYNEEISSANEELQSTNEELATAKEELQSAVEELTTVNEELRHRNDETTLLLNDLNNLFTAINTPILMVDRDLLLRRFTPAAEKFLRLDRGDLGRDIACLAERANVPEIQRWTGEVIDTLVVSTHEIQDHDGCWWSVNVRPYLTMEHRIEGAVLTFANVNSLKRSLQTAEQSRDYANAIVETIRESLLVLSPELRIERVNKAFEQTFQIEQHRAEGALLYQLDDGQWNIPQLRHLLEEVLPTNAFFENFEVDHDFPRIGFRSLSLNARQVVQESGRIPTILLAVEDVTQNKRAQRKLKRSNEDLERFSHMVAHDLQEPIRTIGMYTQLLGRFHREQLGPEAREFMQIIEEGVARTHTMIQDLLTYAKAAGPEKGSLAPVSSESALNQALSNLEATIRESNASITKSDLPIVLGSSQSLTQILQNLIGNALKYRSTEPPKIHIQADHREGEWVFSVCDNGIGFEQEYAEKIFGMFRRLESREYPGTGIGLAICKRIVERFGGRIWAESVRGVGSTFYFTIPV